jgi:hypothetical protein
MYPYSFELCDEYPLIIDSRSDDDMISSDDDTIKSMITKIQFRCYVDECGLKITTLFLKSLKFLNIYFMY